MAAGKTPEKLPRDNEHMSTPGMQRAEAARAEDSSDDESSSPKMLREYTIQELKGLNLNKPNANGKPTLTQIAEREGLTIKARKAVLIEHIFEAQQARLAGGQDHEDAIASARVAEEGMAVARRQRSALSGAGDGPQPLLSAASEGGESVLSVGTELEEAWPPAAAPKTQHNAEKVLQWTTEKLERRARRFGLHFIRRVAEIADLRQMVLLAERGFRWDVPARASSDTPDPFAEYSERDIHSLVSLLGPETPRKRDVEFFERLVGLSPDQVAAATAADGKTATRTEVSEDASLGSEAAASAVPAPKQGKGRKKPQTPHISTRLHRVIDRVLARMVARRDGEELPGGAVTEDGDAEGSVPPMRLLSPTRGVRPTLQTALRATSSDRIPETASVHRPIAGSQLRVGSWNLRNFSVAALSARDVGEFVRRMASFDVLCLLELFGANKDSAEKAVQLLCGHLDDYTGKGPGVWRYVMSSDAATDAHAKATADKKTRGGGKSAAADAATEGASSAGARNEQSAIIWRADSVICTSTLQMAFKTPAAAAAAAAAVASASSGSGDSASMEPRGRLVSLPDGGGAASSHFFRPPLFASFRCGSVDFVVFAFHAAWGEKQGCKAKGDDARKKEFENVAVSIGYLRQQMYDNALRAIKNKPAGWEATARLLWAPVLLCGDFNAQLLGPQHSLFLPFRRVGGLCLQTGRQETVIAALETDSHAYDMIWFFPAIATVDAVAELLESERDDSDDEDTSMDEETATAAASAPARVGEAAMAALDEDQGDDSDDDAAASSALSMHEPHADLSWMVEVVGFGVEDVMGEIRDNLVRKRVLSVGGAPTVQVEPRREAVDSIAAAFEALALPFVRHTAAFPELQAKSILAIARTLVVTCVSDHVPVWAEMSPVKMPVGSSAAAQEARRTALRMRKRSGAVQTELVPRWVPLPPARVGYTVPAGVGVDGKPRVVKGGPLV